MALAPEVKKEIRKMAIGCAICAVIVFAAFCIFDKFSFPLVLGVVLGYVLAIGNFYFMSVGITAALDTGEEIAAKRKLRSSYVIRTVLILAILVGSILLGQKFGVINWIPVAAGVFYVRIVIAARGVIDYFKLKNAPPIPDDESGDTADGSEETADEDEDEDEDEEDEFEKFVGHFAKGPIPKAEDGKSDETEPEN